MATREKEAEVALLMQTSRAFLEEMQNKLIRKVAEGQRGWDQGCNLQRMREMLKQHVERGDNQMVDVANLAMMIWYHHRLTREGQSCSEV
jgi:adenosyl cobinamide kinase/adenosyl cobinamide phosphate guanylyltransferase